MFNSQTGCFSNFVEQDGCARTVIVLLLLTTVGCVSYTWGYYEGISNSQSNLMLDKLHELQLAQLARRNQTERISHGGHGLRLLDEQSAKQHSIELEGELRQTEDHAPETAAEAVLDDAALLEEAAAHSLDTDSSDRSRASLRGRGKRGGAGERGRQRKAGRLQEGGT